MVTRNPRDHPRGASRERDGSRRKARNEKGRVAMRKEIERYARAPQRYVQPRRTTDRSTDRGTSEPGRPPRTDREAIDGAPAEDSPAREPTERVERMEDADSAEELDEPGRG
jgi:hypothetical protein